jgi:hypothetical protein
VFAAFDSTLTVFYVLLFSTDELFYGDPSAGGPALGEFLAVPTRIATGDFFVKLGREKGLLNIISKIIDKFVHFSACSCSFFCLLFLTVPNLITIEPNSPYKVREKLLQIQAEAIEGAVREVEAEEKKRALKEERVAAKVRKEAAVLQSSKDQQIIRIVLLGLVNKVVTSFDLAKAEAETAAATMVSFNASQTDPCFRAAASQSTSLPLAVSPILPVPVVSEKVSVATVIRPQDGPEDGSRQMEGVDER